MEEYYRHWSHRLIYTGGVKWMADRAEAYWLIDIVASYQADRRVTDEEFQHWTLKVDLETRTATVSVTDGNDGPPIITQAIEYTDYPEAECELYLVGPDPRVLMLPSEY